MPSVFMSVTRANIPLWCEWTVPLATMSMPPLCSRSPEKFPWMPSALAYKKQRKQTVRSHCVSLGLSNFNPNPVTMAQTNHEVIMQYDHEDMYL